MTLERKLVAILAADVVGYSRMIRNDEEKTIATLAKYRKVFDQLIEQHRGRIFNTAGDSVLAEFHSPVEAVRCALAVQEALSSQNVDMPPDQQMWFRMGINLGDVLVNGEDLLGDGVNIAARLEGIAEPGGICISNSVREQIESKLSYGFKDLGLQTVKNIPQPVRAYGLVVAVPDSMDDKGARTGRKRVLLALVAGAILVLSAGGAWWYSAKTRTSTSIARFDGLWRGEYKCVASKAMGPITRVFNAKIENGDFYIDEGHPGVLGHYDVRGVLDGEGNVTAKGSGIGRVGNYTVELKAEISGELLTARALHNGFRECTALLQRKPK